MGYMDAQPSRMPGSGRARVRQARVGIGRGRDRPGSGDRDSGFFGVALVRCSYTCNSGWGYLESPNLLDLETLKISTDTDPNLITTGYRSFGNPPSPVIT
jgi:hypothetical protein